MRNSNDRYEQVEQREDHKDYKEYRQLRRTLRNPWFWVSVAALIIIPFTVFAWISNDTYTNFMSRQGCQVVNTFDNGTKVWECPKENR